MRSHRMCSPSTHLILWPSRYPSCIGSPRLSLTEHSSSSSSVWTACAGGAGAWPVLTPLGLLFPQRLQSGTTGVCALITGKTLHIAWLGDSQVILVQQGQVVKLMEPHKPERQVRGSLHTRLGHPWPHCTGPVREADGQGALAGHCWGNGK